MVSAADRARLVTRLAELADAGTQLRQLRGEGARVVASVRFLPVLLGGQLMSDSLFVVQVRVACVMA